MPGTLGRIRLILTNVWPPSVQIAAIRSVTCTLSAYDFVVSTTYPSILQFFFWWHERHDHSFFTDTDHLFSKLWSKYGKPIGSDFLRLWH